MGGGYALALATGHGYSASSTNYGGCPSNAEQTLAGACPVVGSYGGKDRSPMGASAAARRRERCATVDQAERPLPGEAETIRRTADAASRPAAWAM
jgi:dienelactone hydrolase